jgi:hypothetical protein
MNKFSKNSLEPLYQFNTGYRCNKFRFRIPQNGPKLPDFEVNSNPTGQGDLPGSARGGPPYHSLFACHGSAAENPIIFIPSPPQLLKYIPAFFRKSQ